VLDKRAAIQMHDVHFPTTDGYDVAGAVETFGGLPLILFVFCHQLVKWEANLPDFAGATIGPHGLHRAFLHLR
jgi:hypothetical protein